MPLRFRRDGFSCCSGSRVSRCAMVWFRSSWRFLNSLLLQIPLSWARRARIDAFADIAVPLITHGFRPSCRFGYTTCVRVATKRREARVCPEPPASHLIYVGQSCCLCIFAEASTQPASAIVMIAARVSAVASPVPVWASLSPLAAFALVLLVLLLLLV